MCIAFHVPEAAPFDQVPLAIAGEANVPERIAPVVAVTVALPLALTEPATVNGEPYTPTDVRKRQDPEICPFMSIKRLEQSPVVVPAKVTFQ
jgi:hypothetical protein